MCQMCVQSVPLFQQEDLGAVCHCYSCSVGVAVPQLILLSQEIKVSAALLHMREKETSKQSKLLNEEQQLYTVL